MKVTYYGHSCFMVETGGKKLLFDPMISANKLASLLDIDSILPDYILISHGHFDHMVDAERIAKHAGSKVISNYEIVEWYKSKGVEGHHMNIGGKWEFDFGTVKLVSAVHSSVLPDGVYGGAPGGFVIWNQEGCFYFAGDTALNFDMKLLLLTCPALDFAILPIGDDLTMGPDDAIIAASFIGCNHVIGCHYDTFPYIVIDHISVIKKFSDSNIHLSLMGLGDNKVM